MHALSGGHGTPLPDPQVIITCRDTINRITRSKALCVGSEALCRDVPMHLMRRMQLPPSQRRLKSTALVSTCLSFFSSPPISTKKLFHRVFKPPTKRALVYKTQQSSKKEKMNAFLYAACCILIMHFFFTFRPINQTRRRGHNPALPNTAFSVSDGPHSDDI